MHRLIDLVAQALEVHGFTCTRQAALEGRSGTVYSVPLLAEKEKALILDVQVDDPLPAAAVTDMADVLHDVGADAAVVCHTGDVEEGGRADGVSLWGRQDLIHIIGEALVASATGTSPPPLRFEQEPIAESVTELLPPAFREGAFDLDALEQLGGPPAESPEIPDIGAMFSSHEAPVEPASAHSHPLLPVRVTPDEARIRIRHRMERVEDIQMVLQPVHLIDYECDLLAEGSLRYDTVSGRVQVHGTDKTVAEVDAEAVDPQGFTRLPELPKMPSHERTLRVGDERARERSAAFLLESHTRLVDIEVDDPDRGYSYTEKKKVAPRPDHVRLNPLGVFHRVVWRLGGPGGHVDVDALTGEVLEEVLQHPRHDSMVVD